MHQDPHLWQRRPLAPALLQYACDDVSALLKAYTYLSHYVSLSAFLANCQTSRVNYCSLNAELLPTHLFPEQRVMGLVRCIKPERSLAFIHLNLGVSARVENFEDIAYLQDYNGLGQYF